MSGRPQMVETKCKRGQASDPGRASKAQSLCWVPKSRTKQPSPTPAVRVLDQGDCIDFALRATRSVRLQCTSLIDSSLRPIPFLVIIATLLKDVEGRLGDVPPPEHQRVIKFLGILERLTWHSEPKSFDKASSPFQSSSWPRLLEATNGNARLARVCIKKLAERPESSDERSKYQKSLKAFANVKAVPRGPEISELTKTTTDVLTQADDDDKNTKALQDLYRTVSKLCHCSERVCGGGFKANVVVAYESKSRQEDDGLLVESFFLHSHASWTAQEREWKETHIRVLHGRASKVHFEAQTETQVSDFCKLICTRELGRLRLRAVKDQLFDNGLELVPKAHGILLSPPCVSLAKVLTSSSLERDLQRKLLLSYLVSKVFWQFYDSDWIAGAWSKEQVHFMQQRNRRAQDKATVKPKPFISAEFSSIPTKGITAQDAPRQSHIFPRMLALGITLLEIELGEPLEKHFAPEHLGADGEPRVNASHMAAGEVISSDRWKYRTGMYKPVKQAIEICIKPDTDQLGTNPSRVRRNLFDKVVAPLGAFFGRAYECNDEPETFDSGPLAVDDAEDSHEPMLWPVVVSSDHGQEVSLLNEKHSGGSGVENGIRQSWTLPDKCELFGSEHQRELNSTKCTTADQWLMGFKRLRLHHKIGTNGERRYKVAIVDTGIDLSHPFLRRDSRIRASESFIEDDPGVQDMSGHGTHIAGLILDLTNNVELYIAKFTDSRKPKDDEALVRSRVVKALRRARLNWKVDMISLSFGFSKSGPGDVVQEEIENCLNDKIAVFASASNDGGNRPHTYPGRYDRVLCIYSATGQGDRSSFNPTPATELGSYSFSAVGEGVRSCWPVEGSTNPRETHRHMSGTSFATPVAVSIAAFMAGYIDQHLPDCEWGIKPTSPEGVRVMFKLMSKGNERDGYHWLSPQWFFSEHNERKIQEDLKQYLRGEKVGSKVPI